MNTKLIFKSVQHALIFTLLFGCNSKTAEVQQQLATLDLTRGEITLCNSDASAFGTVDFSLACSDKVRADFNLATALLHSFEYTEAEKVFAKVMDQDPTCVMAYWGAAMSNFHSLWAPPTPADLEKGLKIITVGRSAVEDKTSRESAYLEAIATIYDDWQNQDHRTRLLKYVDATSKIHEKYPDDKEAAIFYALALDASADPADKTFANQKKAGEILNKMFVNEPNHPGIAHYLIHNYDYPEIAELGLPAARKYASIAAASAHAQHMPSHIFTRLGLWDEAIQSNSNSVSAAQCYAQNISAKGHWDEELHGLDYLIYAYLQKGSDDKAMEQMKYLLSFEDVFPRNLKDAYAFAAAPARYALERRDWQAASSLKLEPSFFPWEQFSWERANFHFARLIGLVHLNKIKEANTELEALKTIHKTLIDAKENYKANFVNIQIKSCDAWIKLKEGKKADAIALAIEAADMEDATAKHPVTPGEVIPARELLADLYMEAGDYKNALAAYENDLLRHPNRFNGLYGAAQASEKLRDTDKAKRYYAKLKELTTASVPDRPQMKL